MSKDKRTDSEKVKAIYEGAHKGGQRVKDIMHNHSDEDVERRIREGGHKGGQITKKLIEEAHRKGGA